MKKFLSVLLSFLMVFMLSIPAFAAEATSDNQFSAWNAIPTPEVTNSTLSQSKDSLVRFNSRYLVSEYNKFQKMSIDELNTYISSIHDSANADRKSSKQNITLDLKLAWLAAAQVVKLVGYPCAARAVDYSVLGIDYTENDGTFAAKIKTTSTFKSFLAETKRSGKTYNSGVKEFTKSNNSDLFYALHNATITLRKSGTNYNVNVYDEFDFDLDNDYSSLFTSLVNNWAWLCQNTGVLTEIKININFTS